MITFFIDQDARVRIARFTATVGDQELLDAYGLLLKQPDYDATLNDLVDLTGVERLEITAEAMRHLIGMFAPVDALAQPTRLAIVAASDYTFGMSRMYELLRGDDVPEEVRVFRSADDASAWLNGTMP